MTVYFSIWWIGAISVAVILLIVMAFLFGNRFIVEPRDVGLGFVAALLWPLLIPIYTVSAMVYNDWTLGREGFERKEKKRY